MSVSRGGVLELNRYDIRSTDTNPHRTRGSAVLVYNTSDVHSGLFGAFRHCTQSANELSRKTGLLWETSNKKLPLPWTTTTRLELSVRQTIGLTQGIRSRRSTRCSSRRRMWPSQFHRLSLARIVTSRFGSRAEWRGR